jgi:hypothetical protein
MTLNYELFIKIALLLIILLKIFVGIMDVYLILLLRVDFKLILSPIIYRFLLIINYKALEFMAFLYKICLNYIELFFSSISLVIITEETSNQLF